MPMQLATALPALGLSVLQRLPVGGWLGGPDALQGMG